MRRVLALVMSLGLYAAVLGPASATSACGGGFTQVRLGGFPPDRFPHFYVAVEDATGSTFTIVRAGHDCYSESTTAHYELVPGTIDQGEVSVEGSSATLLAPGTTAQRQILVTGDSLPEPVERATIKLTRAEGEALDRPLLVDPSEAPLYVLDDEPTATPFSFAEFAYADREGVSLDIPVFRSGPATEAAEVPFTISPGPSDPATLGEDYRAFAGNVTFAVGERVQTIPIDLLSDDVAENDEQVTFTLGEGSGSTNAATVTISGEGDLEPRSRLHHPKQDWRYPRDDARLAEIHVFTNSAHSSLLVERVQVALRKRDRQGRCAWWRGERFERGACDVVGWLSKRVRTGGTDFFYYRLDLLKPSVGTDVRNYTMFSRAFDDGGNIEAKLAKGRNVNTFEVLSKGQDPVTGGSVSRRKVRAGRHRWRPADIQVTRGDTVEWKNPTNRRHDVTAYGGGWGKRVQLGPGDRTQRRFRRRGVYSYRCLI
ncbi:MAG: Calx-beta domain-containing protein, partial [Actinomycetota bacterium]